MAEIAIRETTIIPTNDGDVVQLHISDAPPDDESAAFVLTISAKLPRSQLPALAQMQRATMTKAQEALSSLLSEMASELQAAQLPLQPTPKR